MQKGRKTGFYDKSFSYENIFDIIKISVGQRSVYMKNNVYELRKRHKLTQEELAKKIGVTRQTIISIEQGKYIASLPLALKMAKIFEVPIEKIFMLDEEGNEDGE